MLILALTLVAQAPALSTSFAADAHVDGARPARLVKRALASAAPQLSSCVHAPVPDSADDPAAEPPSSADVFMDIELLAAGFIDRAAVFASTPGSQALLDEECVRRALRALSFPDRGMEPPTHVVVRFAVRPGGTAPPAGTGPADVADALAVHRDELALCVRQARKAAEPGDVVAGSVIVRARIDDSGGAASVDVDGGSLKSAAARACIERELRGLVLRGGRLPRGEMADVAWPLFFDPPLPRPEARAPRDWAWDAPTLFGFLGCGNAFSP